MLRNPGLRKSVEQPVLDLNFAASQIGSNGAPDSRIDFSRGTNAWFVDSDGLVKKSPHNLILSSETIVHNSSGWLVAGASLEASSESPDGIDGSTKVTWTGVGQLYNLVSGIVAGQTYSFSYYVKLGTKINNRYAVYDHTNSSFIVSSSVVSGVSSSEWTRVSFEVTAPSGCTQIRFYVDRADSGGETGATFITGVQVSQHTTLPVGNPYIKTTGSAAYAARLDHDPTWFMSAAQEQNLLQYSEAINDSYWTKTRTTVTANALEAPDGTVTAELLSEDSSGNTHVVRVVNAADVPQTAGKSYVFSGYLKAGGRHRARIRFESSAHQAHINLIDGTINNLGMDSVSLTDEGNGWFRFAGVQTADVTNDPLIQIMLVADDGSTNYTGDGSSGVYVWGLQLEVGTSPGTYHRTEGAPYYGPGATPKGLLIEEQRANLVTDSESHTFFSGVVQNVTQTADAALAPDGTTTAVEMLETSATGNHTMSKGVTVADNAAICFSYFVKANGRTTGAVEFYNAGGIFTTFNLATKSVNVGTPYDFGTNGFGGIEDYGNGWFRVHTGLTTKSGDTSGTIQIRVTDDGTTGYAGDTTKGLYVWGFQAEQGSFPTSYIQTTGSTATRNADVAVMGPTTGGTELVTNGTFDTDSDWNDNGEGTIGISGGKLTFASTAQFKNANQSLVPKLVAGRRYRASFDVTSYTSGNLKLQYREGSGNTLIAETTGTSAVVSGKSFDFTCSDAAVNKVQILTTGSGTTNTYEVDNVSVRELYPFEQYRPDEFTTVVTFDTQSDQSRGPFWLSRGGASATGFGLRLRSTTLMDSVVRDSSNNNATSDITITPAGDTVAASFQQRASDTRVEMANATQHFGNDTNNVDTSADTLHIGDCSIGGADSGTSSGHIKRIRFIPRQLSARQMKDLCDD